jgi:hypothetical protein
MSVGPFEPLEPTHLSALLGRVDLAAREAAETGVAPESLWVKTSDELLWGLDEGCVPSGAASLVEDLARTVGFTVRHVPNLLDDVRAKRVRFEEAFVVSDEFGVVAASDAAGDMGARFAEGYDKLLAQMGS